MFSYIRVQVAVVLICVYGWAITPGFAGSSGGFDLASLLGGGGGEAGGAHHGLAFGSFPGMDPHCKQISDCPCGMYCVSGENTTCTMDDSEDSDCTCQTGCVLFDRFLAPKDPQDVYGRKCQCGNYIRLVRGRLIWCEKGDWVEQPQGMDITEFNPHCGRSRF